MTKKAVVTMSISGVSETVKRLKNAEKAADTGAREAASRVADIICESANNSFARALYAGVNDAYVYKTGNQYTYWAQAAGKAAPFIEFGTGMFHGGHPNTHVVRTGPIAEHYGPVGLGEYGKGLGKNDYWVYRGDPGNAGWVLTDRKGNMRQGLAMTSGTQAQGPMYFAARTARMKVGNVVREIEGEYLGRL